MERTVRHGVTGEQITFVETASETGNKHLLIEVVLPPRGDGPPLHYHNQFTEEFRVIAGSLTVQIDKEQHVLVQGQSLTAPIGTAHTFRNAHDEEVIFQVKLTPPLQFEESVRIHYGLMQDGLCDEKGNPKKAAHIALILMLQNTFIADKPLWLQRLLFGTLIQIGKLTKAYTPLAKYIGKDVELPR